MSENGLTNSDDFKHVLDEETGELVEITNERREISMRIHERIQGSVMVSAILLQIARDEKIYLAFGMGSFKEYVSVMLPFNESYSYKLLKIADELSPILPKLSSGTVAKGAIPNEVNELGALGFKKLYGLVRLPEADYSKILSKRKVTLADGTELDLRDIEESSSREFDKRVAEVRREYQRKISNLEEQGRKYKGEYQHAKTELEKNQERIERAKELEAKYGAEASRYEEVEHNLNMAEKKMRELEAYFGKIEIDEEWPETIKERVLSIMRSCVHFQWMAKNRMDWLTDVSAYENSAFPDELLMELVAKRKNELDDVGEGE